MMFYCCILWSLQKAVEGYDVYIYAQGQTASHTAVSFVLGLWNAWPCDLSNQTDVGVCGYVGFLLSNQH